MSIIAHIEQDDSSVPPSERCEGWQIHLSRGLTDSEWEHFIKLIGLPDAERLWEGKDWFCCMAAGYNEEYYKHAFGRAWIDSREEYNESLKAWLDTLN
jgi:hypothetical protein